MFDRAALRRVETDARFVNAAAVTDDAVWLATEGGALAWRAGATTPEKYTSLDGLPGNRLTTVVACPLPGLGIVFGGDAGLGIFRPGKRRLATDEPRQQRHALHGRVGAGV